MNLLSIKQENNRELYDLLKLIPVTSCIKGQRIQLLGHIMRKGENKIVRVVLEWNYGKHKVNDL